MYLLGGAKSKCKFASATARPYFSAMSVSDSGPSDRPTLFCDTILRFRPYFAFPSDRPTLFCDPILRFRPYFAFPTRAGPTDRPLAKAEDRSDLPTDRPSPGLPADADIHLDFAPPSDSDERFHRATRTTAIFSYFLEVRGVWAMEAWANPCWSIFQYFPP